MSSFSKKKDLLRINFTFVVIQPIVVGFKIKNSGIEIRIHLLLLILIKKVNSGEYSQNVYKRKNEQKQSSNNIPRF